MWHKAEWMEKYTVYVCLDAFIVHWIKPNNILLLSLILWDLNACWESTIFQSFFYINLLAC